MYARIIATALTSLRLLVKQKGKNRLQIGGPWDKMREEKGRNSANGYSATGCVVLRGPWENQGQNKGQTGQQLLD